MIPQPYHSGSTYPLGGIYPLAQPYYRAILSCLLYHTTQPCSQQLQPSTHDTHSPLTPPHKGSSYHQIKWIDRRYTTPTHATSQLHAIPTLSLCYAYGISLPHAYPYGSTTAMHSYHSHTTHRAMREPQRDHSEPRARLGTTTTGTARHRDHQRADHNGRHRPRAGMTLNFWGGAGDQQPLTFFGFA